MKVTGIPMEGMETELTEEFGSSIAEKWTADHMDEIMAYAADHTQEESVAWLMDQILPEAGKEAETVMDAEERKTSDYRLILEKDGDDWKNSHVEVKAEKSADSEIKKQTGQKNENSVRFCNKNTDFAEISSRSRQINIKCSHCSVRSVS